MSGEDRFHSAPSFDRQAGPPPVCGASMRRERAIGRRMWVAVLSRGPIPGDPRRPDDVITRDPRRPRMSSHDPDIRRLTSGACSPPLLHPSIHHRHPYRPLPPLPHQLTLRLAAALFDSSGSAQGSRVSPSLKPKTPSTPPKGYVEQSSAPLGASQHPLPSPRTSAFIPTAAVSSPLPRTPLPCPIHRTPRPNPCVQASSFVPSRPDGIPIPSPNLTPNLRNHTAPTPPSPSAHSRTTPPAPYNPLNSWSSPSPVSQPC